MILMIDNYDSFTYNIVQYIGELGADIQVKRNDQISIDEIESLNPKKIVISPGGQTPTTRRELEPEPEPAMAMAMAMAMTVSAHLGSVSILTLWASGPQVF